MQQHSHPNLFRRRERTAVFGLRQARNRSALETEATRSTEASMRVQHFRTSLLLMLSCALPLLKCFSFEVPTGKSECFQELAKASDHVSGDWYLSKHYEGGSTQTVDVQVECRMNLSPWDTAHRGNLRTRHRWELMLHYAGRRNLCR